MCDQSVFVPQQTRCHFFSRSAESTARIAAFTYQRFCRSMCLRSRKSEPTQRGNKSACISLYMCVTKQVLKKIRKRVRCVCTSSRATASIDSSASRDRYGCLCWSYRAVDVLFTSFNSKMTVCKKIRVQDVRKLKGNDILHFFCPYTMMMMSRSRTRLLSKKSSIKRGTKRAAKRDGICSSIFSPFARFKTSLLLMILSAILMSENFEFSPFKVGVEGKKQRQKSSSSSSFEAFQNERREKRGAMDSRSVFLSHSVFLVVFFSIPRSYRLCLLRVTINNNSRWI